jgi:CheY-like chemotaxis protein
MMGDSPEQGSVLTRLSIGRSLLVIHQDAAIRTRIAEFVRTKGYWVEEAADADMAVRMTDTARPNLILLNLALPSRSSLDVLIWLKENQPMREVPITIAESYALITVRAEPGVLASQLIDSLHLPEVLAHLAQ